MKCKLVDNQLDWDSFLVNSEGSFVQSWEWGEALVEEGKNVERLGILNEDEEQVGAAQVVYSKVFGFKYAFAPKGPVFGIAEKDKVLNCLREYLKTKGCIFFRMEPIVESLPLHSQKTIDVNPRATTVLSLEKPLESILKEMHEKTRYNIKLSEKKGLIIEKEKDFHSFVKLMRQTGERDKFRLHDEKHYKCILDSKFVRQYTAIFDNKKIATILTVSFGSTATYLFGASDYEFRKLMSPYLLQWEAIKDYKSEGIKKYDFFGIAPSVKSDASEYKYDEKHQYSGVTRFKIGFGGKVVESIGTADAVINPSRYKVYQVLRKLRRAF